MAREIRLDYLSVADLGTSTNSAFTSCKSWKECFVLIETGTVGGTGSPTLAVEGTHDGTTTQYSVALINSAGTAAATIAVTSDLQALYKIGFNNAIPGIPAESIRLVYTTGTSTTGAMQVTLMPWMTTTG